MKYKILNNECDEQQNNINKYNNNYNIIKIIIDVFCFGVLFYFIN